MAITKTSKNFKNKGKDIKYLNKDFTQFRGNLIEFAKTYFPQTYSDFNESSPGMMFIEMASYIGDSLSYYVDDTLKESLMVHADDIENVIALSQYLGYKPKVTSPSVTTLSVYQLVPSIGTGADNTFDETYFLRIKEGMRAESTNGVQFVTQDVVDFSDESDREVTIYQTDSISGEATFYLVKKFVQAISADVKIEEETFGSYKEFQSIELGDTNIIDIYDVRDSDGNKFYEVPYLAQELVFVDYPNTENNDPDLFQFKETTPYILNTLKTSRRFVKQVNPDSTTTIQFGSGDPTVSEETIIPSFKNVGLGLPNSISKLEESFDPTNFLKTKTYGTSPSNTTITVKYLVGGGVESNVKKGSITQINGVEYEEDTTKFSDTQLGLYNAAKNSIAVDNEVPATGGKGGDTMEEIRQNALANFGSQNRAVTAKDYQVRALSMPTKFGSIAKAYATADGKLDNNSPASILASPNVLNEFTDLVESFVNKPEEEEPNRKAIKDELQKFLLGKTSNNNEKNNPFAINLYLLGYDSNKKLSNLNRAIKENLKTYLSEYKILTDGININDGFIINIGLEFEIITLKNYNKSEVLSDCISELKEYFDIDNFTFNNTVNISELELIIANVDGVSSVPKLKIINKCGGQYANNSYNIEAAIKDKILYPSLDPSVFEIKFPDSDIKGRAR
jgi:hypothetical protein|tara:strand:+ start:9516 stop:11549 length:2034 start_codon:yes stop_codon:yes gene_type:complete